jgi:phosphate transport system protein
MASGATSSQEFAAIRTRLEELASAVLEQSRSLKSTFAMSGAKRIDVLSRIIARDTEIDSLELSLDELTMAFMNFRAPLGRDLRYAIGAIDVAAGLERIGDCVEYIARNLRDFGDLPTEHPAICAILKDMADKSNMIMEKSIAALLAGDAVAAAGIPELDNLVDALQDQAHDTVLKEMRAEGQALAPLDPETGLHLVACANKFESIADIACHIAETVVFIVQAKRIRHGRFLDGLENHES